MGKIKFSSNNTMNGKTIPYKIVVFDMDETLGCFTELGLFWSALQQCLGQKLPNEHFFNIVDIFPEFIRPGIFDILQYLREKKENGECDKVMIYTNNNGPKNWVRMIRSYFDNRLGNKIFDQIIAAFKVKGNIIEVCRTSHDKNVYDLIKCSQLPKNTEIFFIDDQEHRLMKNEHVWYVLIKPYTFSMPFNEMAERYCDKFRIKRNKEEFIHCIVSHMSSSGYSVRRKSIEEIKLDSVLSKAIMKQLDDWFKSI
jgi:hypothetical protein